MALAQIQAAQGQTEYRLSQIFLAAGSSGDEASLSQSAQRLKEQLDQGADFAAIASEFSQDQGSIRGGDWGWVRLDMLDPQVAQVVQTLPPGQIGGPIRGTGGWVAGVSDPDIVAGIRLLAETTGIFTETAGGATVSGACALAAAGRLRPDDEVVLCITGNGLKTVEALQGTLPEAPVIAPRIKELEALYGRDL